MLGLAGVATVAVLATRTPQAQGLLGRWILSSPLTAERVAPLVGLGIALALLPRAVAVIGMAAFATGMAGGVVLREPLMALLIDVPGAPTHLFYAFAISCLVSGLTLLVPRGLRSWLAPVASLTTGAMAGLATKLTDPSLNDPAFVLTGAAIGVWVVAVICLTVRAVRRPWFEIPARILGSWLIAIGLLFAGAGLLPGTVREPPPADRPESPDPAPMPSPGDPFAEESFPDLDAPGRTVPGFGDVDRLQP